MERWEDHLPECVSPPSGAHEEKWDNSPDVVRRIGAVAPVSSFWVWSRIHLHPQKSMAGSDLRSLLFHWHAISSDPESAKGNFG
jgi:hypothetical protein